MGPLLLCTTQAQSVLLAFHAVFMAFNILWFSQSGSCWSYMTSWLGLLPLQLVTAAAAWEFGWLFMPKSPEEDPIIQVHASNLCCFRSHLLLGSLLLLCSCLLAADQGL